MADMNSDPYNWNIPASHLPQNYLVCNDKDGEPSMFEGDCPPNDLEEVNKIVVSSGLNHGDVIRFGEFRDVHSYILNRQDDGTHIFIRNPDYSASGYLTIPHDVLRHVADGIGKYDVIIKGNVGCVTLHLPRHDVFIKEKLGHDIPSDWKFTVSFSWGKMADFYISTDHSDWVSFEPEHTSLQDMKTFFEGAKLEQSTFVVKMDLKNEQYEEYKRRYGDESDSMAWMLAVPDHPATWRIEPGAMGMGSSYCRRDWICQGPKCQEDEVRQAITVFLEGFDYRVVGLDS